MGNQQLKTTQQHTYSNVEMLCSLTQMSYNSPNYFNFNPFSSISQASNKEIGSQNNMIQADVGISMVMNESNETIILQKEADQKQKCSAILQQNQSSQRNTGLNLSYLGKTKQIQKSLTKMDKTSKCRQLSIFNSRQSIQRSQNEIINQQYIRDQNNCKSYHKLVKNYLLLNQLGYLIEPYESKYHTRYYFIIALLIIKHHINANWISCYQQIVMEELSIQEKKIQRKFIQINKLSTKMKESGAKKSDISGLLAKKIKLEKQIDHIEVIKHQIGNYSLRSCAAFFNNNIEEALKILYLKDDPVMRKRSYYENAVSIVKEVEQKMQTEKSVI